MTKLISITKRVQKRLDKIKNKIKDEDNKPISYSKAIELSLKEAKMWNIND